MIIQYIKDNIENGRWLQGNLILSENQLCDFFKVARGTAKDAINELCVEGLLERKKGKGTFVKKSDIKQEFILILSDLKAFTGDIRHSNRNILNKLKECITKVGYKPIVFMNNGVLSLQETLEEVFGQILGIIDFYSVRADRVKIKDINVPCVSIPRVTTIGYPSILLDFNEYFNIFLDIINKNNYNNILVFDIKCDLKNKNKDYRDEYIFYAIEKFFERYNMFSLPCTTDKSINIKHLKVAFDSVTKTPDAVFFIDDSIFYFATPLFPKYDFLKKVPIVTQSSYNLDIPEGYNISQVAYDLDTGCKKAIELLEKLINKEFIREYSIYLKPTLIPSK